mgnify:CR=1 FL=1
MIPTLAPARGALYLPDMSLNEWFAYVILPGSIGTVAWLWVVLIEKRQAAREKRDR